MKKEGVYCGANHWEVEGGRGTARSGGTLAEVTRKLSATERTYYRWRRQYEGCG